jgi:hypothetical protein
MGDTESIGGEIAVGHLTTATVLSPDATFASTGTATLSADAEVALQLGRDVAPDAYPASARRAALPAACSGPWENACRRAIA